MGSDYKRIILLKGLEAINEYQFSIVKSLLARDLRLTRKMQEEYNKVQIADLMERKFPGPACVDKLVKLFKDIEELGDVVKILKNEKKKVMRQSGARGKEPMKKRRQDSPRTDESTSTVNEASGSVHDTVMSKKKKIKTTQQDESMRTQPTQEQSPLPGPSATSTQSTCSYPQTPQMPPPTPGSSSATKKKKMETTQNDGPMRTPPTQGQSPLPGPSATSTQSTCSYSQTLQMPAPTPGSSSTTKKKKMETTQNDESMRTPPTQGQSPLPGPSATSTQSTCSYPQTLQMPAPTPGSSSTTKKNVLSENIILYEIQDNTGKIEVLVYGRLTNVNCEEGDKLRLICFELSMDPRQLRSVIHSFIKVIKPRKNKKQPLGPDSHTEISL
ncbi:gamma-interferon-inducible protein 16-like isoform X2 [Mustela lutreola]|uniref:gamma-interferon-inducible protein 16-like isoform X2 n=1 Tax=Mustela lutreola TaxID=9666 RepID=UPI0027974C64|nr:gamma-interferon-inducible protein 16-like isoform X2 [Mustela lutreola]